MKIDRFTWTVVGIVALLLVAAVVTVNRTDGDGWTAQEYMAQGEPEAPVFNAFLAFQRGDVAMARAQYSEKVLAEIEEQNFDPFSNRYNSGSSQRLRIVDVQVFADEPDRAQVNFVLDNFSRGGLFDSGSTWSRDMSVQVVREGDEWKINTQEFFY